MRKPLISLLLSATCLLTAGAARGWAGTITFSDSSLHPDSSDTILVMNDFGMGGNCASQGGSFECLNFTTGLFVGADATTTADDSAYDGGTPLTIAGGIAALNLPNYTGSWTGTFDASSDIIPPFNNIGQTLATQSADIVTGPLGTGTANAVLAAALGLSPSTAGDTVNQLEVVTPGIEAVPESSALILVGMGLVLGAKYLRRRRLA